MSTFTNSAQGAHIVDLIEKVGRMSEASERMQARMTECEAKLIRIERHLTDLFGKTNAIKYIQP